MTKLLEKRTNDQIIRRLNKGIIILYHVNCTDGFSAAWVAWKKFGNNAEYIGVGLDDAPLRGLINKEIYSLDFTYKAKYIPELLSRNKKLVVIDHHITNTETAKMAHDYLFDLTHSAAVLTWKYFYPNKETPRLLKHVEDVDLWKFKVPYSKEISSVLDLYDFNFKKWNDLVKDFEKPLKYKEYIKQGKLILDYQDKLIERLIASFARPVIFAGYETYVVNSPSFHSQIGSLLVKKHPPIGIVWREEKDGSVHVSLRSDGTVDVSNIAVQFGGGGHKTAAGFFVENVSKLPWKTIKDDKK